nr:hypothetical protein [Tanacetum cinerariifolium]
MIALMAYSSHYGSDDHAEVHNQDNVTNQAVQTMPLSEQSINYTKINLDNKNVNETLTFELERYKDQVRILNEENNVDKVSDSCAQSVEIYNLKQTLSEHLKEKESLKQTVTLLKNDFQKEESRNIDREIDLEKQIKELNNIVFKRNQSAQTLESKLYDGSVIQKTNAIVIYNSEETLRLAEESRSKMLLKQKDPMMSEKKVNTKPVDYAALNQLSQEFKKDLFHRLTYLLNKSFGLRRPTQVEVPKELPKVSMVNTSLKKLKHHLASFDVVVKERTTVIAITEGTWGFEHTKDCFRDEIIPFLKALKDCRTNRVELKDLKASLQEKVLVIIALKDTLSKIKGKAVVDEPVILHPINPELLKIDVAPLAPKLQNNRTTHYDYLKHTQEEIATLREIVKHERSLNPLNTSLDDAYSGCSKHMTGGHSQLTNFVNKFLGTVKFDLEVAFRQHTCFIHNLKGVDLSTRSQGNNLYTLSLGDMMASSLIYLLSKESKTKSWLWHRRLSHLNFGAINHLARQGLVRGLPKLKFEKDHLCSACAMGKSKKKSYKPKSEDTNQEKLYLLHMDLCGLMRVESVNGKKYILVIVDDYSIHMVRHIRIDNGTEFVNQTLREYYEQVGISYETSVARSLQQNGVVERRNRTLIEAARTMLIYIQALLFLWAEAVAIACYTQNRSIVCLHHGKTPYELLHGKLSDLSFLRVFGALCYSTNDSKNLGKLQQKADIGIFIGYAPIKKAFRIYNRRTRRIIENIHVDFDELTAMAFEQSSSGPALHEMTPANISSGLVPKSTSSTPFVPPSRNALKVIAPEPPKSTGSPSSTTVDQDAPSPKVASDQSLSTDSTHTIMHPDHQISQHNSKWTKDHPLENIISQLARPVSIRLQLHEQALFYYYDAFLTYVEPKTYKDALTQSYWIEAMQEDLNEFERLEVVQIVLWYLDSRCSKHMTEDRSQLTNFVHKFLGTVKFGNDHVVKIMGYGDYKIGNVTILRVYFVEGLGHILFSVGQFIDSNLEVAFRQHTCFIRNLEGVDLLTRSRGNNLYTLSLGDMMASSLICLLSKASKTKSWLWH